MVHFKQLSVLKIVSIIHLVATIIWTLVYYNEIAHEGWGVFAMTGLLSLGIVGLFLSGLIGLICAKSVPHEPKKIQNLIEAVIVIGFIAYMAIAY